MADKSFSRHHRYISIHFEHQKYVMFVQWYLMTLASTCGNSTACLATKQEAKPVAPSPAAPPPPPPPLPGLLLLPSSITAGPMEEACSTLNTLSLLA